MPIDKYPVIYECKLVRKDGIVIDSIEMMDNRVRSVQSRLNKRFYPQNGERWVITPKRRLNMAEFPKGWSLD